MVNNAKDGATLPNPYFEQVTKFPGAICVSKQEFDILRRKNTWFTKVCTNTKTLHTNKRGSIWQQWGEVIAILKYNLTEHTHTLFSSPQNLSVSITVELALLIQFFLQLKFY